MVSGVAMSRNRYQSAVDDCAAGELYIWDQCYSMEQSLRIDGIPERTTGERDGDDYHERLPPSIARSNRRHKPLDSRSSEFGLTFNLDRPAVVEDEEPIDAHA